MCGIFPGILQEITPGIYFSKISFCNFLFGFQLFLLDFPQELLMKMLYKFHLGFTYIFPFDPVLFDNNSTRNSSLYSSGRSVISLGVYPRILEGIGTEILTRNSPETPLGILSGNSSRTPVGISDRIPPEISPALFSEIFPGFFSEVLLTFFLCSLFFTDMNSNYFGYSC